MDKKDIFNNFSKTLTNDYGSNVTVSNIIIILISSLILSLLINYTYRKAFFGVLYQRSFAITLVIITIVTSVITVVISGNLALSLGMVGALSIIRYRTAVKDPIDIAFLFWSVAVGIANGVFAFQVSFISSIFISLLLIFFSKFPKKSGSKLFFINLEKNSFDEVIKNIEKKSLNYKIVSNILNAKNQEIILDFSNIKDENNLLKNISLIKGVNSCSVLSKNSNSLD
jgi:uncharacterized membrane protein YhiD involved in acid resistance